MRLSVGLDYLKMAGRGVTTFVHIRHKNNFAMQALQAVGISSARVLTGTVHAKALLIPELVGCGSPSKHLVQLTRIVMLSNVLSLNSLVKVMPILTAKTPLVITVIQRMGRPR